MSEKVIIEILPVSGKWKVFEALGVEPIFEMMKEAIRYARSRANFRSGEIRIRDKTGGRSGTITFDETKKQL